MRDNSRAGGSSRAAKVCRQEDGAEERRAVGCGPGERALAGSSGHSGPHCPVGLRARAPDPGDQVQLREGVLDTGRVLPGQGSGEPCLRGTQETWSTSP